MYLQNCRLRKTFLDKCLKSRFPEYPGINNMANGSKHCCNLNDSIFTTFINHLESNCVGKSLFY